MVFTSEDAARAFEELGKTAVPYKTVKAKLKEWGASPEESAIAVQDALDKKILLIDQTGALFKA